MAKFDWNSFPAEQAAPAAAAPQAPAKFSWDNFPAETAAPDSSKPTSKIMARMDELARSQGYKDYADQSAQIGKGVMGGQIAALASPAVSAANRLMGRATLDAAGAAAESAAPAATSPLGAIQSVNNSAPIRNLPRPGTPLFGGAPVETAPSAGLSRLPAAVEPVPAIAQKLAGMVKGPLGQLALGGAVLTKGPDLVKSAIHNPEKAAAVLGAGLAMTPAGRDIIAKQVMGPSTPAITGQDRTAVSGLDNLMQHNGLGGFSDDAALEQMMGTPKIKALLIQAAGAKPKSPEMDDIYGQIQNALKGTK